MTVDPRAALLREFVRLRIPHECDAVRNAIGEAQRSLDEKYESELEELRSRKSQKHPHFLRVPEFEAAVEQLNKEYKLDCEDIRNDLSRPYFQSWRATDLDWRKLAVKMAFERHPASFVEDDSETRKGDDHWQYDLVMENVIRETGLSATKAAPIAAKYINGRIDAGEFTRQYKHTPDKHVNGEEVRQAYSTRHAARGRITAAIIPDTLDAFASWARSADCPEPQNTVVAMLPPKAAIARWMKDEAAIFARFRQFCAKREPKSDGEAQRAYEEFHRGLSTTEKEEFSSWGRLKAHFDHLESRICDAAERRAFGAIRQRLTTSFHRHRNSVNNALMDEMIAGEGLPSYVRCEPQRRDWVAPALEAAESLSRKRKL